jgi:glycosyltransferase involved in cell wall biosynthesis
MPASAVLHVTSFPGGGVDRHIRDIARASARRHLVWHAAEGGDAIEVLDEHRVLPLDAARVEQDPQALAAWLRAQGVGLIHAHAVTPSPRRRATWAAQALGARTVVTLHDVLFLRADAFTAGTEAPDAAWLDETRRYMASAAATVAPSDYLAAIARRHLPDVAVDVVPNGSGLAFEPGAIPPHPAFREHAFRHVAVVLGAIGPHKGARMLEEIAERLDGTDIGIVVVGYLDARILPGWHRPHLFVHGTYLDPDVAALVRGYHASVGLFPNRVPESFSYALSDLWAAGVPVIVPPEGALGERVSRHGGGWLLPRDFAAGDVARLLAHLFSAEGSSELARVKSALDGNDPERLPRLDAMSRSLEALYARFGLPAAEPLDPASPEVQRLLATSLDGSLFRAELVRLADEMGQLQAGLASEREIAERTREWIAKLEADIGGLKAELTREVQARQAAQTELFEQRNENARAREALRVCRAELEGVPRIVRRLLRKKPSDGRG